MSTMAQPKALRAIWTGMRRTDLSKIKYRYEDKSLYCKVHGMRGRTKNSIILPLGPRAVRIMRLNTWNVRH